MQINISKIKNIFFLHILFMVYSLGNIFTKMAGRYEFGSIKFCICYFVLIVILGGYAIGWQQIIKRVPLTTAFANKAVVVIWGLIWGRILFCEEITIGKVVGASIVMAGVILYTLPDKKKNGHNDDAK